MTDFRGKSLKAIIKDVGEGYITINPIFLKSVKNDQLKPFLDEINKYSAELRSQKFPYNDTKLIRERNMRLQRLSSASFIIRNYAKERRIRFDGDSRLPGRKRW